MINNYRSDGPGPIEIEAQEGINKKENTMKSNKESGKKVEDSKLSKDRSTVQRGVKNEDVKQAGNYSSKKPESFQGHMNQDADDMNFGKRRS